MLKGVIQVSAGVPGAALLVHVNDVLHQQVPLQAIDTVSVQNHLMSAGWAAETTAGRHSGATPCRQVRVGRLQGAGHHTGKEKKEGS